jgi:hypothetical protein
LMAARAIRAMCRRARAGRSRREPTQWSLPWPASSRASPAMCRCSNRCPRSNLHSKWPRQDEGMLARLGRGPSGVFSLSFSRWSLVVSRWSLVVGLPCLAEAARHGAPQHPRLERHQRRKVRLDFARGRLSTSLRSARDYRAVVRRAVRLPRDAQVRFRALGETFFTCPRVARVDGRSGRPYVGISEADFAT